MSQDNDTRYEEILARRAEILARTTSDEQERQVELTAALVAIGSERFAIPVGKLREIIKAPPIAVLPELPPWMPGIVQIRGELISVVDIARWFGLATGSQPELLAVIEGPEGPLGLLVDAVLGFRDIYSDEIATSFSRDETAVGRPIRAITRSLIALVDVERLLLSNQIIVDRAGNAGERARQGFAHENSHDQDAVPS
jgi:chemotaxis signal transduction protein